MFGIKQKNLIVGAVAGAVLLFLLFQPTFFNTLKFHIIGFTQQPMRLITLPFKEMKKLLFYHRTYNEYIRLTKEANVLKTRIINLDELIRENKRLENLLDFKHRLVYSSLAARVIGRDPTNWSASMSIDKGSNDHVKVGQAVVDSSGIVGKIAEVGENFSKVILLTDPQFSVAALVQRPRESGLVSGTLMGLCRLRYLKQDADVKVGDKVITSKLSSSFPEGLLIGEVVEISEDPNEPLLQCLIKPAVSISQVEEVLIILQ